MICYIDHCFKSPSIFIKWYLYWTSGWVKPVKSIQVEKVFQTDMKTIKYIHYYIVYEDCDSDYDISGGRILFE